MLLVSPSQSGWIHNLFSSSCTSSLCVFRDSACYHHPCRLAEQKHTHTRISQSRSLSFITHSSAEVECSVGSVLWPEHVTQQVLVQFFCNPRRWCVSAGGLKFKSVPGLDDCLSSRSVFKLQFPRYPVFSQKLEVIFKHTQVG